MDQPFYFLGEYWISMDSQGGGVFVNYIERGLLDIGGKLLASMCLADE